MRVGKEDNEKRVFVCVCVEGGCVQTWRAINTNIPASVRPLSGSTHTI